MKFLPLLSVLCSLSALATLSLPHRTSSMRSRHTRTPVRTSRSASRICSAGSRATRKSRCSAGQVLPPRPSNAWAYRPSRCPTPPAACVFPRLRLPTRPASAWRQAGTRLSAQRVGAAIGRDCRARGVHYLLGPGVNLYRAPMNGRNFEYMGEDPAPRHGTMARRLHPRRAEPGEWLPPSSTSRPTTRNTAATTCPPTRTSARCASCTCGLSRSPCATVNPGR